MSRETLKVARKAEGMTQQQVADKLGISLRYYQEIEDGEASGGSWVWDPLEDLFGVHQRTLREIPGNRPGIEANRKER